METLPDPLQDRVVTTVLPPPQLPLSREKLFPQKSIHIIKFRYSRL